MSASHDVSPDDTLEVPVSSVRFQSTEQLRALSGVRYDLNDLRSFMVTGGMAEHHVRAYQEVSADQWVEVTLHSALTAIAESRLYDRCTRHPVVAPFVRMWTIVHDHISEIEGRRCVS